MRPKTQAPNGRGSHLPRQSAHGARKSSGSPAELRWWPLGLLQLVTSRAACSSLLLLSLLATPFLTLRLTTVPGPADPGGLAGEGSARRVADPARGRQGARGTPREGTELGQAFIRSERRWRCGPSQWSLGRAETASAPAQTLGLGSRSSHKAQWTQEEGLALGSFVRVFPDPATVPFKCLAVVTLLAPHNDSEGHDHYFYMVALLLFRLLQHPEYKLPEGVEAGVIVPRGVARDKVAWLEGVGARVFDVEGIFKRGESSSLWKYCYNKFYAFNMVFYDLVAVVDADMYLTGKLVGGGGSIFSALEEAHKRDPGRYLFGAVQDVGFGKGYFNAGMFVLEPEKGVFQELVELIPHTELYDQYWMEQGLLNYFFSDMPNNSSNTSWVRMSDGYNARNVDKAMIKIENLVLLHWKPWKTSMTQDDNMHHWWLDALEEVGKWELQKNTSTIISDAFVI